MNISEEQIKEAASRIAEPFGSRRKACIEMAKWIQEHLKPEWIDIKEQQPEFNRTLDCLAKGTRRRVIDVYYNEEDLPLELFYTHWMYSPNPPTSTNP